MKKNILNDLDSKSWIKFQKSWFIHNPPPRGKNVLSHPAKFPESIIQEFIEFFTKKGGNVLDPMAGTGSTMIACLRSGRNGFGIELNKKYANIAQQNIKNEIAQESLFDKNVKAEVVNGDARDIEKLKPPLADYCITSPPYWDMLNMKGAKTQKERKEKGLDVSYSEDNSDLGNIENYDLFVGELINIYIKVINFIKPGGYMTVILKNVKKKSKNYPLAWDVARELGKYIDLKDEKIWCQDNQSLMPYGLGSSWVSNTLHHYCLNFKKAKE